MTDECAVGSWERGISDGEMDGKVKPRGLYTVGKSGSEDLTAVRNRQMQRGLGVVQVRMSVGCYWRPLGLCYDGLGGWAG